MKKLIFRDNFQFIRYNCIVRKLFSLILEIFMNTTEEVQKELVSCLSGINSDGIGNVDPQKIDRLNIISAAAAANGMSQGKKLIDNLVTVLKAFKEGKSAKESVSVRLTALDFYLQNTKGSTTEEL